MSLEEKYMMRSKEVTRKNTFTHTWEKPVGRGKRCALERR